MYIRTKDGIFRAVDLHNDEHYVGLWNPEVEILAKSENLAELCDGVIEKCLSGNRFHYIWNFNKQEAMKVMNIDINKGYKEFYFGIFVNHNNKIDFISFAKMNEKGDLELI